MADIVFDSRNREGIPSLLLERQIKQLAVPCRAWGSFPRKSHFRGGVHFYVDDYRFSALLDKPDALGEIGITQAVEPNISIFDQTPYAIAMYQIYRKRWVARYWQELCGIDVAIDVNIPAMFYELNWLGVPAGWWTFATRAYDSRIDSLAAEYAECVRWRGDDDLLFIAFGGGKKAVQFAASHRGVLLIPYGHQREAYGKNIQNST